MSCDIVDILTLISFTVLAVVLSLLMLELGAAVMFLSDYKTYKSRLYRYIAPVWEITGTFSVFYLVSLEAFYPSLLAAVGNLYIFPIILAVIFIIIRDAFLAYSEYAGEENEAAYSKVYGVTTIIALFLLITVLSSSISGAGVSLSPLMPSYIAMFASPFNILMFVSIFSLVMFSSTIFFSIRNTRLLVGSFIAFIILLLYALYAYVPYLFVKFFSQFYLSIPAVILLIAIAVLYMKKSQSVQIFVLPFLFTCIMTFELLEYPFLWGGAANIVLYLTPSINTYYLAIATAAGGVFLLFALAYLIYLQDIHKRHAKKLHR